MSTLTQGTERVTNPAAAPQPRLSVLAMPEYHPPLAAREALRLDFNENTAAASPRVLARLQQITAEGLTIYPEREGVERIVAQHLGLEPGQLLLTNGVDEAIHLLCCAYLAEAEEALIPVPTFAMYAISAAAAGARVVQVPAERDFQFPGSRSSGTFDPATRAQCVVAVHLNFAYAASKT